MGAVLFEFVRIGSSVRVSAIDEETGREAIIQGPASAGQAELKAVALKKLRFLLEKEGGGKGKPKA